MGDRYVCCSNPNCRPFPGKIRSWKPLSALPAQCKYCGHSFQLPGGAKKTKQPNLTKSNEFSDDQIAQFLRKRFQDDPDKASTVDQWFPQKPKSHADRRKEAYSASEAAFRRHNHESRKLLDMESSYQKQCEELVAYRTKLAEQRTKTDEAKHAYGEALSVLQAVDAAAAPRSSPFPPTATYPPQISQASTQLTQLLSSHMSPEVLQSLGGQISTIIRNIAVVPPPPPTRFDVSSDNGGDWDDWYNSGDGGYYSQPTTSDLIYQEEQMFMEHERNKRSMHELDSGDESVNSQTSAGHRDIRQRQSASDIQQSTIQIAEELAAQGAMLPETVADTGQSQSAETQASCSSAAPAAADPSSTPTTAAAPTTPNTGTKKKKKQNGRPNPPGGRPRR